MKKSKRDLKIAKIKNVSRSIIDNITYDGVYQCWRINSGMLSFINYSILEQNSVKPLELNYLDILNFITDNSEEFELFGIRAGDPFTYNNIYVQVS